MNLGKPAVLDISAVVVASEGGEDGGFSAIFQGQIGAIDVAEGGNGLPKGGDITLQSRQLQGGTKIKVSGQEPSEEGLAQFALSQGMDPRALTILRDAESSTLSVTPPDSSTAAVGPIMDSVKASAVAAQITQAAYPSGRIPSAGIVGAALETHALIDSVNRVIPNQGGRGMPDLQVQIEPLIDLEVKPSEPIDVSAVAAVLVPAHTVFAAGEVGRAAKKFESAMPVSASVKPFNSQDLPPKVQPVMEAVDPSLASKPSTEGPAGKSPAVNLVALAFEKIAPQLFKGDINGPTASGEKLVSGVGSDNTRVFDAGSATSSKLMPSQIQMGANPSVDQRGSNRSIDIAPLSQLAEQVSAKPATAEQVVTAAQTRLQERQLAGKMVLPKADEAMVKRLVASRQQTAVVKMAPINLVSAGAEQASIMLGVASAAPSVAAFVAGQMAVDGSGVPSQVAQAAVIPTPGDTAQDDPAREMLRRQNEQDQLSQRLSQVLGQRLSAQIERGSWRVEMDLHPASMGRIEVQLEMKNGELEANFLSSNPATRELLNDSMPRLREMFEQFGMNSAYLGLGSSNQGQSDGNSPSGQSGSRAGDDSDEKSLAQGTVRKPVSDDGLDVLV
jgi:flagellar hook-length control protein FliK